MAIELFIAVILSGVLLMLVLVAMAIWIVRGNRDRLPPSDMPRDDRTNSDEVVQLESKVRQQRTVVGCLVTALIVTILGLAALLVVGYLALGLLRDLGRGHPG